jgi:hypothetical protein
MLFQYGGGIFQDTFYYLQQWGILDVLIPFMLIFTIVYAVLQKINIFAKKDATGKDIGAGKRFNAIIALAITLTAIIPHVLGTYPPGTDIIVIINNSLPEVVLLIVAVLLLMIMLGLVYGEWPAGTALAGIAAIGSAVILIGIFLSNIITIPILSYLDPQLQTLIVVIVVFGLVFLYVTYESEGKKTWGEQIGSLFKEVGK